MSQTGPDNRSTLGYTTKEKPFISPQQTTPDDNIIYDNQPDLARDELSVPELEILSIQEPQKEEWTSAHDYGVRMKARLAEKWNVHCRDELERLKGEFLIVVETKNGTTGDGETGMGMKGELEPLSLFSSEKRSGWLAKRALLWKGRQRDERCIKEVNWMGTENESTNWWGSGTTWWEQEDEDQFEEHEVMVTWEEMILRESGQLEYYCPKPSRLRKSWTVRDFQG